MIVKLDPILRRIRQEDAGGVVVAGGYKLEFSAEFIPVDINTTKWANITSFPALNFDSYNIPTLDFSYDAADGCGGFHLVIPENTTSLIAKISAFSETPEATGTTMDWKADFCIERDGATLGSILTVTLGSTAMSAVANQPITGTYTIALTSITDGTLTVKAGDRVTMAIYPDTGAADPKQCNRQVSMISLEVA